MKKIKELINQITRQGWVTIISVLATILIIVLAVWLLGPKTSQNTEEVIEENTEEQELINSAVEAVFTKEDVINGSYRNDVQSATTYVRNTQEVNVAVVINELYKEGESNTSCGQITFVKTRVPGPAVLTNTLIALFNNSINTDFMPGNIIPKYHPDLSFEKAIIENQVASIYVKGTFSGANNSWCDSDLAIKQIVETAKGFSTVQSVKVYQNGVQIY